MARENIVMCRREYSEVVQREHNVVLRREHNVVVRCEHVHTHSTVFCCKHRRVTREQDEM